MDMELESGHAPGQQGCEEASVLLALWKMKSWAAACHLSNCIPQQRTQCYLFHDRPQQPMPAALDLFCVGKLGGTDKRLELC